MRRMSKWLVPALLMIFAGILVMGCTSETEPGEKIKDPDFVSVGGEFYLPFDSIKIEEGKLYEVTLTISDFDDDLLGSRLGGKLIYKDGEADKLLSGFKRPLPEALSRTVSQYTWEFIAGQKNSDSLDVESPATTPEGKPQFFQLIAQTSTWQDFPASESFGIKGSFSVQEKAIVSDWVSAGTVTLGNVDGTAGKGELSGEDMVRIRALVTEDDRSILRLTVQITPVTGTAEPGWGIVSVGTWDTDASIGITVPSDAVIGQPKTFDEDISLKAALDVVGATGNIVINPFNGATVTKAELFKPGQ